jgi:hypothetical protein
MRRKTRSSITNQELGKQRGLRLSQETVRILRGHDLSLVAAGCDTTSYTTDRRTLNC